MRALASKDELAIFLAQMDKWEKKQDGSHSRVRDHTKRMQRKIARTVASLTDDEVMIVLSAAGACGICERHEELDRLYKAGEKVSSPWSRLWERFAERAIDATKNHQHIQYYALLAPVWNALRGQSSDPGYCMRQAIYQIRDTTGTMSFTPVIEGERAEELRAKLIGIMMHNDALDITGLDLDDVGWFGANWERIASVWQELKRDHIYDRKRVELLINHKETGGPISISSGAL